MRLVGGFIVGLIAVVLVYLLNNPINVGEKSIPALGKLLNPFTGFWQNAEKEQVNFKRNVQLPNLSGKVDVQFDEKMVPHIFADNMMDAVSVQGFLTAQHRLWQMEFITYAAGGRVSEILGKGKNDVYLNFDKTQRRIGMLYGAENTLEAWKNDKKAFDLLEAYAEGVNAYIESLSPKDYPIEYKLIGYAPEKWTPLKTSLLLKYMSNSLCGKAEDVLKTNTRAHLGTELFDELFPEFFDEQSPIIPDSSFNFVAKQVKEENIEEANSDLLNQFFPPSPELQPSKHIGSNNWAVAAEKTANGNPILCNDPHLPLNLPSIWYELQIHTPETNVYGVSLPGAPGIVIGFNEFISWGVTNVSWDVKDWFTIEFENEKREKYLFEGKYKPTTKRVETFKLKSGETVADTVLYTHWGPVVYDNPNHPYGGMALKWLAHYPTNDISTFVNLNTAKSYDDYRNALKNYACPAQNFVFASKSNDIALTVAGNLPLKTEQQGRFVQDGSKASSDWQGFIPFEHNPHSKNPEQGFIGSANQHSTFPDYPYYYNGHFDEYRGRHLNKQLKEMSNIKITDLQALQMDNYSVKAEDYVPVLLKLIDRTKLTSDELENLKLIESWNFRYDKELLAPSLFEFWCTELTDLVWQDKIPDGSVNGMFSSVISPEVSMIWPDENILREILENKPNHKLFDKAKTVEVETAVENVTLAYQQACILFEKAKSKDWRSVKHTSIGHLARIDAFSRKNRNIGGHGSALNATTPLNGPSWRMLVELGDEVKAWGVYPGGQSGNPASKYYDNMLDKWTEGEYYELFFMKDKNDKRKELIFLQSFE